MIYGMVNAYGDPFTNFVEPVQHELTSDSLEGSYGGIGAKMGFDADGYVVLYPFPDSPASRAGIQDGDRLLAVDGVEITPGDSNEAVLAAVRGPVGKRVTLLIARSPDYETSEISIKREEIPLPSVTWHIEPSEARLGVIEINIIAASTTEELQRAIEDLTERGATHFVLDLRGNRGGLMDAGVDTARLFLSEGTILEQQYRDQPVETFDINEPGPFADLPVAVLVDENTASAAEIVAGALQAHDRAKVIGMPTFGKDVIQLVFDLKDGSSLHVTSAKWWIPGLDHPVGEGGIDPDIHISTEVDQGEILGSDKYITAVIEALLEP
jgi:carboxyl-terminal processing protease